MNSVMTDDSYRCGGGHMYNNYFYKLQEYYYCSEHLWDIPVRLAACSVSGLTVHLSLLSRAPLYFSLLATTRHVNLTPAAASIRRESFIRTFCLIFLSLRIFSFQSKDASEAWHKPEADSEVGPSKVVWPPPHRAVDARLSLQRERPHLEPWVSAARQEFRGVRPPSQGSNIRPQEELGGHRLGWYAGRKCWAGIMYIVY